MKRASKSGWEWRLEPELPNPEQGLFLTAAHLRGCSLERGLSLAARWSPVLEPCSSDPWAASFWSVTSQGLQRLCIQGVVDITQKEA